jgi:hypothetical protein
MKSRCRLIRRNCRKASFYCVDTLTGKRTGLQTADEREARQIVEASNNATRQASMNLQIAQVYLRHADPGVATRTWQFVLEQIISTAGQLFPVLARIHERHRAKLFLKRLATGR